MLVAAAVLLAVSVFAVVVAVPSDLAVPSTSPPSISPGAAGAVDRSSGEAGARRAALDRPGPAGQPVKGAVPMILRGRCVALESGQTLAECRVTVTGMGSGAVHTEMVAGEFELLLPSQLAGTLAVEVHAAGRLPLRGELEPAAVVELSTLRMRRGVRVFGRLLDAEQRPVAGASIFLAEHGRVDTGCLLEQRPLAARTAADGRFELADPLGVGSHRVDLRAAPPLRSASDVVVDGAAAEIELNLVCAVVDVRDQLRGLVVDRQGQPVADALVQAYVGTRPVAAARTTGDGGFVLFRSELAARGQELRLTVLAQLDGEPRLYQPSEAFVWGEGDARVVLEGGAGLTVLVSRHDGRPVTEFQVQVIPLEGARTSADARLWGGGRLVDGRLVLRGLRSGPHLLLVHPRGADASTLQSSLPREFSLRANQQQELRVELSATGVTPVVVRTLAGTPVAGSRVEFLVLRLAAQLCDVAHRTPLERFMMVNSTRGPSAIVVATATTDAAGVARVPWTGDHPISVRVGGAHVPWIRDSIRLGDYGGELKVQVEQGARLHGTLGPAELMPFVHATSMPGDLFLVGPAVAGLPVAIGPGGVVRAVGLPPGRYEVFLRRRASRGVRERLPKPLTTVVLVEGRDCHLDLDLRGRVERAGVSGTLRDRRGPLAGALVRLVYNNAQGSRCRAAEVKTDASGVFSVRGVTARDYRLQVRRRGTSSWLWVAGELSLQPGRLATVDKFLVR